MGTNLLRILKYGFQQFWRHGWLSAATIVVMVLALLLYQGLIIFGVVTDTAVASLQDKIDIAVYFKSGTAEADITQMQKAVEALPEVKSVEYVSADRALEIFKAKHIDDANLQKALNDLQTNPLLASLNVKANNPNNYAVIATYVGGDSFKPIVDNVTYAQNQEVIDRLNRIVDTLNKVGLAITIFIAFAASLVAFNTIRLAIYSSREEIGIMRLVGGSNTFIKGPYLVSGILYGVLGAIATLIITAPAINFSSPYFKVFIPEIDLQAYFYSHIFILFGYLLIFGVGLGIVSSWVAIRRYLRV